MLARYHTLDKRPMHLTDYRAKYFVCELLSSAPQPFAGKAGMGWVESSRFWFLKSSDRSI